MVWDGCEHHLCIRTPAYSVLWAPGAGRGVRPSITAVKSLLYSRGKEGGKTKAADPVPAVGKSHLHPKSSPEIGKSFLGYDEIGYVASKYL